MAKIVVITDMDEAGSGYKNLCVPLLTGLSAKGHEIKVAGMGYQGKEHGYPFSVIPAGTIQDAHAIASNLFHTWQPDLFLVAMDIPLQQYFYEGLRQLKCRYMAITPLENGPLTLSWAAVLLNMDAVFFISELGKQEAIKSGISKAEHLIVGVDTVFWHPATPQEKTQLHKGLGIGEDEFVVLTVADNQERKNLAADMEIIASLKEQTDRKIRYIMVTRVESPVGWRLDDYSIELGLTKEIMKFNRGLPVQDLWGLYAVSDAYLSSSKAEGLGMPVLEAMACGIPCVVSDVGAHRELLENNRGWLIPSYQMGKKDYIRDVWGNSKRGFINVELAAEVLQGIANAGENNQWECVDLALNDVQGRTWDIPVTQVHQKIEEILNEQK
jgi:glycosyltransferase involved in cell wall biosynthesis